MRGWKHYLAVGTAGVLLAVALGLAAAPTLRNLEARSSRPGNVPRETSKEYNILRDRALNGESLTTEEKARLEELSAALRPREDRGSHLDNTGGPDDFGYAFMDNQTGDTATYSWIELRGDPQATWFNDWMWGSHDDAISNTTIPIGFNFPFYGQEYGEFWVCTNGHIQFASQSTQYWDLCLPIESMGPAIILWGDDLHLDYGGIADGTNVVGYRNFGDYFVIEFDSIGHCCQTGASYKFEAILFPDGKIKLQYNQFQYTQWDSMMTIGIQESATGAYLQYVCDFDGYRPVPELAIWFAQPSGLPSPVTGLQGLANGSTVTLAWVDPVTDIYGDPLVIDSVRIELDGTRVGAVAAGVQLFTQPGVHSGMHTYSVRAYAAGWASSPARVSVLVGNPSLAHNFDLNDGGWLPTGGWEWGTPTNSNPHSAPNVWGDRLSGNYASLSCDELVLNPGLAVVSTDARIEFECWYTVETWWDGVNFQASVDGGTTWEILQPSVYPYNMQDCFNNCIGVNPNWSGTSNGWQHVVIPFGHLMGQTPIFKFLLGSDEIINFQGFLLDDVLVWGLATPAGAPVAGTITLDGGSGNRTQVVVRADGAGSPSTSPNASGAYTLANVQTGARTLTAALINYTTATRSVVVPPGGIAGQNMTLRRLPPPAPTGLTASQDTSGQFVSLDWNNSTDALVDIYRVYRKVRTDTAWTLVRTAAVSQAVDTLSVSGAFQYCVTAVDTNVTPPAVESPRSVVVQVLYGAVPPSGLSANGRFDDRIRLSWFRPGTGSPPFPVQYDDGSVERWVQIHEPNTTTDHFAIRFDMGSEHGYPLPLRSCNVYLRDVSALPDVWLCPDVAGRPDVNAFYAHWTNVAAAQAPGWLTLPVSDGTLLSAPGAVWLVWRQPAGVSLAVGADETEASGHSFASQDGSEWWPLAGLNLIGRIWAGGDDSGEILAEGPAIGHSADRLPQRILDGASPQQPAKGKSETAGRGPVAKRESIRSFGSDLSHAIRRTGQDLSLLVPLLEFRPLDRHHSTLDDPDYYIVYRDSVDIAHPTAATYDNFVAEGITYSYYVTAHYPNGTESTPTNTVTAMARMAPGAPTNLSGMPASGTQMLLTWTDPTVNADGTPCVDLAAVRIYRNDTLVGAVAPGVQQFTDTPPFPNRLSLWSVRGIDEVANEGPGTILLASVVEQWQEGSYDWVDISTAGTPVVECDDCTEGPFAIGFPFPFYGNVYDSVYITSNGFIAFEYQWAATGNDLIPSTWDPNNAIYPFWDDLNPGAAGEVRYYSDPVSQEFIVSYLGVAHWAAQGFETFQIVLRPDGSVLLNYQTIENPSSCTVGVENEDGDNGIMLWYNGPVAGVDWTLESGAALEFWGLPPSYCDVSGHVAFDGGAGIITQVTVSANGSSHPSTHPNAAGNYVLHDVVVGNRILSASLTGYHTGVLRVTIPDTNGLTNQNFVLRRLDPPAPTNLTATINSATGRDSLHWDISPDLLVDGYRVYRKLRDSTTWVLNRTVGPRTNNWAIDTISQNGIYQYRVTAIDTNVIPPAVESPPSSSVQVLFGELPPENLAANGRYDDRIRLTWSPPGAAGVELFYDSVDVDCTCVSDGLGFNGQFPFAWFVAHYQGNGPVQVFRVKTRHWPMSTPGAPVQMAVFEDAGGGIPTVTPLGVRDTVITNPATWLDVELAQPVTINSGSFFVGIRQVTSQRVDIGMDFCAQQMPNTFFYNVFDTNPWTPLEQVGFPQVLCMRAIAAGNFGQLLEMQPTPVQPMQPLVSSSPTGKVMTSKNAAAGGKQTKADASRKPEILSARITPPRADLTTQRSGSTWLCAGVRPWNNPTTDRGRRTLDDIIRYRIYRNGSLRDSVAGTVQEYWDVGLIENQTHSYYVRAVYDNGVASPPSNTVTAACNMAPGTPTNLSLTAVGLTQMRVQWVNPVLNADGSACVDLAGLRIYRDGVLLASVAPAVTQYLDQPPDPMTFYLWEVAAYDEVPNVGRPAGMRGAVQSPWRVVDYEWLDVWNMSTPVVQCDDCAEGPFDLGFPFVFYGQTYNSTYISSNGFTSFINQSAWGSGPIPNTWEPNAAIYAFSTDLYPVAGNCRYYSDPVHQRFVVTFQDCPHYASSITETFQIVLEAENGIRLAYQAVGDASWCLVGVENATGTEALQLWYSNSGDFMPTSQSAVQFWGGPNSAIVGTVRAFGTSAALQGVQVWAVGQPDTAITDATGYYELGIEPGTYSVTFHHPQRCDTTRTNVVVVAGEDTQCDMNMRTPSVQFSHTSLTMSTPHGVNVQASFTISNNGGQCPLTFSISDTCAWLTVNQASGIIPPNQSVQITATANVQGMPPNSEHHSALFITYNTTGSPRTIQVDLFVGPSTVDGATEIPTDFAYHSNYPNPFNATTTLAFDVPRVAEVAIVIYNLAGQEVARPVSGVWPAGRYRVLFDAAALPSGMYLVRMNAGGFSAVGKMLLLK